MLKNGFFFSICVLLLATAAVAQPVTFELSGDNEVPPVATDASGSCEGLLNALATEFTLDCTHTASDVVMAHIHMGPPDENGPIVFFLDAATTISATVNAETLQQQLDDGLPVAGIDFETFVELGRGNSLYVNVHTPENPGGELRGNIDLPNALYFAQFGAGPNISSQIVLLNETATPASGVVRFNDDAGDPMPVPVDGVDGETPAVQFTLDGFGITIITTLPTSDLRVGSAAAYPQGEVDGFVNFGIADFGLAGVLGSGAITNALAPVVVNDAPLNTGIAVVNAERDSNTISCTLRSGGTDLATESIALEPIGHQALFVNQLFPTVDFSGGFAGSVECSSDGGFAMIVLQQGDASNGLFSALPVIAR